MKYKILYVEKVYEEDIPSLSKENRVRIRNAVTEKLTVSPEVFGKPLRTSMKGFRSLRVGDYRVIFLIREDSVLILAIMHRSVVYRNVQYRVNVL
ncbi:type II toxin-antitoxin system RelE/ParE family toxin [Candidatus Peregrinibacteria bacterium]|nr:type II toxin-antitoxin system RelE/ParE family toxin [Candidatus Peregrinibacteria bacterium]